MLNIGVKKLILPTQWGESLVDVSFKALSISKQIDCVVEFEANNGRTIGVKPQALITQIICGYRDGLETEFVKVFKTGEPYEWK